MNLTKNTQKVEKYVDNVNKYFVNYVNNEYFEKLSSESPKKSIKISTKKE